LVTISRNIIVQNGRGIQVVDQKSAYQITFSQNDVFQNSQGNYVGTSDQTGVSGNISANPLFGSNYCLESNSPAIINLYNNTQYMGHKGPCGFPSTPLPTSTPTPFPTPTPTGTPTSILRILTQPPEANAFLEGEVGVNYRNFFMGQLVGDTPTEHTLSLSATNLPPGLSVPRELCSNTYHPTDQPQNTLETSCALDGIPTTAGSYTVTVTLRDLTSGRLITRNIPITIKESAVQPWYQTLKFRVRFNGVNGDQAEGAKVKARFVNLKENIDLETAPFTVSHVGNGVYEGIVYRQKPANACDRRLFNLYQRRKTHC